MSASGQTEKYSARADCFRSSPNSGRPLSPKTLRDRILWNDLHMPFQCRSVVCGRTICQSNRTPCICASLGGLGRWKRRAARPQAVIPILLHNPSFLRAHRTTPHRIRRNPKISQRSQCGHADKGSARLHERALFIQSQIRRFSCTGVLSIPSRNIAWIAADTTGATPSARAQAAPGHAGSGHT